jgi:threonine dehydrogenase-like Zn-dependent dehydrogenase
MLAVHLENGKVEVRKQPLPRIPEGFARIRLLAAGICSTDLELQRGYYGFSGTPGHEFVGEVTDCDDKSWLNKRVCGEINLACGECEWCSRKLGRHCPTRTVLGIVKHPGAFREFLTLPIRNLHRVPASISTEAAVFIEPIAAACEILDQVKIPKGERVAVLGDGKLGLLIAQVLKAHGAQVHLFGRHREKLRLVEVTSELVGKKMPQQEFAYTVDSTGSNEGLATAIAMTQPRGTVVMKSTVHGLVSINTAVPIVNEITLVGSRCGRMEAAIPLLASGKVKTENLISDRFALGQASAAFAHAARKGVLKVLLH